MNINTNHSAVPSAGFPNWEKIRALFEDDSGNFPEICICNLSSEAVIEIFTRIKSITKTFVGKPFFFDRRDGKEKLLLSEENPAGLVVKGEADPFHFLVRGLEIDGTRLPDLGVFVLQNAISLDFEPGREWGECQTLGFITLLSQLSDIGEKISTSVGAVFLRLEEIISPELRQGFLKVFSEFRLKP